MGQPSDELIEKIWSVLFEKQQSINRQMEESEKKFFQRTEENRLLQEKIEKKFFDQLEENRLLQEKIEKKYFDHLEEKERQLEEIWQKIYQELEANRLLKEEHEAALAAKFPIDMFLHKTKRQKNKHSDHRIEMAEHPVYAAILRLFSERGYQIDSDTIRQYWELVTAITRSAANQDD